MHLQRILARFAGSNTNGIVEGVDEDFSVTDLTGLGGLDDRIEDHSQVIVRANDFDLYFGNEIDGIFGAAIDFSMSFLATVALDLADRHSVNPSFREGIFDVIQFEMTHDSFNFFHSTFSLFARPMSEGPRTSRGKYTMISAPNRERFQYRRKRDLSVGLGREFGPLFLSFTLHISMKSPSKIVLGLDFGTESVRALLADTLSGEIGSSSVRYEHGQILDNLPGSKDRLPPLYAFQHPQDWIDAAAKATRAVLRKTKVAGESVAGIGVDFTSCTMLPAKADGTPLCLLEKFRREPFAWPKLWKHHGAQAQTDRINQIAKARNEKFLARYGGLIGLEWFFPKILETLEKAPHIYDACEVWLEAGDWLVWQLVGGPASSLPRSTCQAGYKGMWNAHDGYPSEAFLAAVHPD